MGIFHVNSAGMRISVVLAFIVALCAATHASPTYLEKVELNVHSYIDDLVRKALEYIRSLMQKQEPFPVPDLPQQTVTGDGIHLVAKFNNLKVSNASDFTIDHIENNVLGLWAKFGVTVPRMYLEGGYQVLGTIKGKGVSGNGNFRLNITQLGTTGYVKLGISSFWLQITEMDIDYTIQDLKFDEDGLVVSGMKPEEIKELFSKSFLDYFKNNEKYVSSQVSEYVKGMANGIMHGKNLKQLIQWLEDVIHGNIIH